MLALSAGSKVRARYKFYEFPLQKTYGRELPLISLDGIHLLFQLPWVFNSKAGISLSPNMDENSSTFRRVLKSKCPHNQFNGKFTGTSSIFCWWMVVNPSFPVRFFPQTTRFSGAPLCEPSNLTARHACRQPWATSQMGRDSSHLYNPVITCLGEALKGRLSIAISMENMEDFGRFWCHFSSTLTAYQSMKSRIWENDITLCTCWNHLASQCCCHLNTMVYAEKNHHPPEIWYLRPNQDPELALHSSRFSVCQPGCLGISPAICKAEQFALGPSF